MTMTAQQRRKRSMTLWIIVAILAVGALSGKTLLQLFTTPDGYLKQAPEGNYSMLDWKTLQLGEWGPGSKPKVIADVLALDGQTVSIRGFLLPLHDINKSAQFFIAPKESSCYFCSPPGVSEVIQVNIKDNQELDLIKMPVTAYGTLKVATGAAGEQVLYTIDNAQLSTAK